VDLDRSGIVTASVTAASEGAPDRIRASPSVRSGDHATSLLADDAVKEREDLCLMEPRGLMRGARPGDLATTAQAAG
jgi:hypothetical protein